jgi:hypothetical protein
MQRTKIRRSVLVIFVVLAAASMFPFSLGGSSHRSAPPARQTTLIAKHQRGAAAGPPGHVTPVRNDP